MKIISLKDYQGRGIRQTFTSDSRRASRATGNIFDDVTATSTESVQSVLRICPAVSDIAEKEIVSGDAPLIEAAYGRENLTLRQLPEDNLQVDFIRRLLPECRNAEHLREHPVLYTAQRRVHPRHQYRLEQT